MTHIHQRAGHHGAQLAHEFSISIQIRGRSDFTVSSQRDRSYLWVCGYVTTSSQLARNSLICISFACHLHVKFSSQRPCSDIRNSPTFYMGTHRRGEKLAANLQTTIWNEFISIKNLLKLFLETIAQYWFRWWLGAEQATCYYLNQ